MGAGIKQLIKDIEDKPGLENRIKENPKAVLKEYESNPKDWDVWIYRIVVLALGFTVIFIVIGVLVALIINKKIESENLVTIVASIGSAAIGALAGLLAPSPARAESK